MGFSNFKKITKKIDIPLDDEIKKYIEDFDFSIFYSLPLSLILNDIANTHLYFKYFNELYVVRIPPNEIPTYNSKKSLYMLMHCFKPIQSMEIKLIVLS